MALSHIDIFSRCYIVLNGQSSSNAVQYSKKHHRSASLPEQQMWTSIWSKPTCPESQAGSAIAPKEEKLLQRRFSVSSNGI
jgi:hypothetical protein